MSTNCFPVCWYVKPLRSCTDSALFSQNNLNVISLERGDFKFSIGNLNNKFSRGAKYFAIGMVFAKSRFQHGGKRERSNAKNYGPNWRKKKSETK